MVVLSSSPRLEMKKSGGKKSRSTGELGRSLVNQKSSVSHRRNDRKHMGEEGASEKYLQQSMPEESSLEEFLATAQLAGTEFTAERLTGKIMDSGAQQELVHVAMPTGEEASLALQTKYGHLISIPRRPPWNVSDSREELEQRENRAFLDWRRQLAALEQTEDLLLTPFERNLELWRQLWRVVERSDALVQIVDARNPLAFWSEDLDRYATETDPNRACLLLLNKADLLSPAQRQYWADYLEEQKVEFIFWSATGCLDEEEAPEERLVNRLQSLRPDVTDRRVVVGMVGYPNVGKSSTVNRLLGQKKAAVSSTPGKTRHLQTLIVDEHLVLCDCPGLIMPSFALSREEMLLNGILPVSQMRDHRAAIRLLCARLPKRTLETAYGLSFPEADGDPVSVETFLTSLAFMRGFMSAKGIPDSSRAARLVVSDVGTGKLLYASPPPSVSIADFDRDDSTVELEGQRGSVQLQTLQKRHLLEEKATTTDLDASFFRRSGLSGIHQKSAKHPEGKKHFNRNKNEKLRRIYKDLDA